MVWWEVWCWRGDGGGSLIRKRLIVWRVSCLVVGRRIEALIKWGWMGGLILISGSVKLIIGLFYLDDLFYVID